MVVTIPKLVSDKRLFDLFVLRVGRVQILQHLACRVLVDVHAQHERLGQRAVDGRHRDGTLGLLEIGQRRGEHAQPGQRGAQGDLGRVGNASSRSGSLTIGVSSLTTSDHRSAR